MPLETENETPHNENENLSTGPSQSAWKSIWQNNKGMFLVIISEWFGSSMDAIVRFLQQGGHGMHPFQVRPLISSFQKPLSPIKWIGHCGTHGHDIHPQ
jgi:hypothetical protein